MRELTCITGGKKSLEDLAFVHTHPQNYAFVSNNVAFYFVSTARPPDGGAADGCGCHETVSSCSVLTEANELQLPFWRAS